MIVKIIGKLMSYGGLIKTIVGSIQGDGIGATIGVIMLVVGCIFHELDELPMVVVT